MIKVIYRPFGLLISVLGGLLAGRLFKQAWRKVTHEIDTPDAKDRERGWGEIIAAATVEGAVFGGVKALLDRAGASGFARVTGAWPGNTEPVRKTDEV